MVPKRRRWLTALGLFLAGALGGVLAYLLARRTRHGRREALDGVPVAELSARLRREAAWRERRARRRPAHLRWPWSGRRRAVADLSPRRRERQGDASPGGNTDDQKMAARGHDGVSGGLRGGRPDGAAPSEPAADSGGGASHAGEDPLVGA